MEKRKKILIDTDIGDDIDDAFALLSAMALDFEIVGVTTVFRDTDARARMVKKLMRAFGKGYEQVPVFAGYDTYSKEKEDNTEHMCRFEADLSCPVLAPDNRTPDAAIEFLLDCCRRYGSDLTLLAIGPFCNIAKAIEKDKAAINSIGQVVIMGGAYFKQYADWNVMCDVPAADVMFENLTNLACIGADVTHRLVADTFLMEALHAEDYRSDAWDYVRSQYRIWQADYPENKVVLHDVLTVYYALDPSICSMDKIPVKVITAGFAKGFTLNVNAYSKASLNAAYKGIGMLPTVLAAADVDLARFHAYVRRDILSCRGGNPS